MAYDPDYQPTTRKPARKPRKAGCDDCDAPYGEDGWCDVVIPDEIWNSLNAGILCFRCMTKRLEKAGYGPANPVPVIVASGPYRDANEEWRMIGLRHGERNIQSELGHIYETQRVAIELLKAKLKVAEVK